MDGASGVRLRDGAALRPSATRPALAATPSRRPARQRWRLPAAVAVAAALLAGGVARAQEPRAGDRDSPYRVDCANAQSAEPGCRTDTATYIGWRVFLRHCATCHAEDAEGSSFAPSLVARLRDYDRRRFFVALDEGYFGPSSDLPPWGENPDVARYYEELWSFLRARANGDLPPVPLEPLRSSPD